LLAILKACKSLLVSLQGVEYHESTIGFLGTTMGREGSLHLTPHKGSGMDEVTKV
jgi:hypothetical protein